MQGRAWESDRLGSIPRQSGRTLCMLLQLKWLLWEAAKPDFIEYQNQVKQNAKRLAFWYLTGSTGQWRYRQSPNAHGPSTVHPDLTGNKDNLL